MLFWLTRWLGWSLSFRSLCVANLLGLLSLWLYSSFSCMLFWLTRWLGWSWTISLRNFLLFRISNLLLFRNIRIYYSLMLYFFIRLFVFRSFFRLLLWLWLFLNWFYSFLGLFLIRSLFSNRLWLRLWLYFSKTALNIGSRDFIIILKIVNCISNTLAVISIIKRKKIFPAFEIFGRYLEIRIYCRNNFFYKLICICYYIAKTALTITKCRNIIL